MDKNNVERHSARQKSDDREMFFGFLALLSLAFPALAIRALLPDLNPLLLVGIGLLIYFAYFAWLLRLHAQRSVQEQLSLKRVVVTEEQDQVMNQMGVNRE